jgi:hypothetical protein
MSMPQDSHMQAQIDAITLEVRGDTLFKVGRDLAIIGCLLAACAYFLRPDFSAPILLLMKLAAPVGLLLYGVCLFIGTELQVKAIRRVAGWMSDN